MSSWLDTGGVTSYLDTCQAGFTPPEGNAVRQIDTLRWRIRLIDFALAALAAVALWAVGLAEVAWLPFATIAIASERTAGRCRPRR